MQTLHELTSICLQLVTNSGVEGHGDHGNRSHGSTYHCDVTMIRDAATGQKGMYFSYLVNKSRVFTLALILNNHIWITIEEKRTRQFI